MKIINNNYNECFIQFNIFSKIKCKVDMYYINIIRYYIVEEKVGNNNETLSFLSHNKPISYMFEPV